MYFDKQILTLLNEISVYSTVLPLGAAAIAFRSAEKMYYPLFVLIFISFAVEIVNQVHTLNGQNNFYIFRVYTVVEFSLISVFFYRFYKSFFNAKLILVVIFLFYILAYLDNFINGADSMDELTVSIESLILSLYSLYLYYFILKRLLFEKLLASPVFWMNTAILTYFSGNLLLFIFSNQLLTNDRYHHLVLWSFIHSSFNVLFNVILAIGFWKTRKI